ncbi:MAG: hypothetical protein JOZ53_12870 [Planctomycetaceae bacterium]|nr:hypothetical protein [Planctomycetaceae bacterium]
MLTRIIPSSGTTFRFSTAKRKGNGLRNVGSRARRSFFFLWRKLRVAAIALSRACWRVEAGRRNRSLVLQRKVVASSTSPG